MSSTGGASRGHGSMGGASRGTSAHGRSLGTQGKAATHTAHAKAAHPAPHGKTHSPAAPHAKRAGHAAKDSFEGKAQNAKIQSTVSKLNPAGHWLAKDGKTFCNQFAAAYAHAMGDKTLNSKDVANKQIDSLAKSGSYRRATAAEAMKAAAEGKLAFATWQNPAGGHGHIAAVVGETGGHPAIAQAGPKNYNFTKVTNGFGSKHPPTYYVHN